MPIGEQLRERVRERGRELRDGAADRMLTMLREECPVGQGPAQGERLVETLSVESFDSGEIFGVVARARAEHASYTDSGADPHDIFARNAKDLLVFEVGGQTIFVNTSRVPVRHPGSQGTRWFSGTVEKWHEILEASR